MIRADKSWLSVVLWMGLIFIISTDLGSAAHTSRFVEPFLRWLKPDISDESVATAHMLLRKTGHMIGYAILSLLALKAARSTFGVKARVWSWRAAKWALIVAALYAASDEFHQSFVGSRGASVHDVLIDTCGAALALLLKLAWMRLRYGRPELLRSTSSG